jgi:outer membrane receptor protein involved in Fe transport
MATFPRSRLLACTLLAMLATAPAAPAEEEAEAEGADPPAAPAEPGEARIDEVQDFNDLSLEELLSIPVGVATRSTSQSVRESPGILTVITREEIRRSGARDLQDVLRMVPGFQIGADVMDSVFLGVRGLWAAEGKVLVLLDGHELHEPMYANTQMTNRFSADLIERVEVIRGPGSVVYGGAAELAVVNVISVGAASLEGAEVTLSGVGHDRGTALGQRTLSAAVGHRFEGLDGLALAATLFVGQTNRSDQAYTDVYGGSYSMLGQSHADPMQLTLSLGWRGLQVRYLVDYYRTSMRSAYDFALPFTLPVSFLTSSLELAYRFDLLDGLTLTPRLRHMVWRPWNCTDPRAEAYADSAPLYDDSTEQRVQVGLELAWAPLDWLDFLLGAEYALDTSHDPVYHFIDLDTWDPEHPDSAELVDDMRYHRVALYLQGLLRTEWVHATVGARLEWHDQTGVAFVPRAGLHKAYGPFHFKALVSQAFRSPANRNLSFTPDVEPEKTTVYELELGYQILESLSVVANGFYVDVRRPIIYYFDERGEGYRNFDSTGSYGFETELRFKRKSAFANLSFSYYSTAGLDNPAAYAVPGRDHVLLGFSPYKFAFLGGLALWRDLSLNLSGVLLGDQRYGIDRVELIDGQQVPHYREYPAELVMNVYLLWENAIAPGLYAGLGVYNMLDVRQRTLMPYDSWHNELPGPGLEIMLKLGYRGSDLSL